MPFERPRKRILLPILAGMALLVIASLFFASEATSPDLPTTMRVLLIAFAAALLYIPVTTAWITGRRRWKTGSWLISAEERRKNYPKWERLTPAFKWLNRSLTALFILIAGCWITRVFRGSVHGWDIAFPIIWIAIALNSLWTTIRRARSRTTQ